MTADRAVREVGQSTAAFTCTIERVKLIEFAQALHLGNPVYSDLAAAVEHGYRDVVACPGFINSLTLGLREVKAATFGLAGVKAVAGEMRWESRGVVCAGDRLSGRCVLARMTEKAGRRPMDALEFETELVNQFGDKVLTVTETTLVFKD